MSITLGTYRATPKTRELVESALSSGHISYGPMCGQFESQFALRHGALHGVFTNSGTSSLQIALQAMKELHGWQDGDEVIVPALTFVATVNVVYHCRLTPVLVDVDPNYYDLDPDLAEAAITPRTRAMIPVHLFGQPAPMDRLSDIATRHDILILEDSCEAINVSYQKRKVGSWGHAAAFSTYVAHHLTTGVGGMTITRDDNLHKRMRSIANHGLDVSELPVGDPYDPSFLGRKFLFTSIGHSFRGMELQAALGLAQLEELNAMIEKRQKNAAILDSSLAHLGLQLPSIRPEAEHSYMVYPIVLLDEPAVNMRIHLGQHQIESRSLLPLTTQPCYNFSPGDYPVANWLQTNGFYVGCHQDLLYSDLDRITTIIENYFKGIKETYRR